MATKFNIVKHGYEPTEVDQYIQTLEDSIRRYKEKDDSIKNAILSAQIAADNIVRNAKAEAGEYRKSALRQVESIRTSISYQRELLNSFQKEYSDMLDKYLKSISGNDVSRVIDSIDALERYITQISEERQEAPSPTPETPSESEPEENDTEE